MEFTAKAMAEIRAALTAQSVNGMVLVPREPTKQMCIAGHDMQLDDGDQVDIYKAMIAAAEKAQGGEK